MARHVVRSARAVADAPGSTPAITPSNPKACFHGTGASPAASASSISRRSARSSRGLTEQFPEVDYQWYRSAGRPPAQMIAADQVLGVLPHCRDRAALLENTSTTSTGMGASSHVCLLYT